MSKFIQIDMKTETLFSQIPYEIIRDEHSYAIVIKKDSRYVNIYYQHIFSDQIIFHFQAPNLYNAIDLMHRKLITENIIIP